MDGGGALRIQSESRGVETDVAVVKEMRKWRDNVYCNAAVPYVWWKKINPSANSYSFTSQCKKWRTSFDIRELSAMYSHQSGLTFVPAVWGRIFYFGDARGDDDDLLSPCSFSTINAQHSSGITSGDVNMTKFLRPRPKSRPPEVNKSTWRI